ncbi:hypothetical protein PG985_011738 [Apiospora marii]|uniref:Aminoglycoside phosphotransferase domain-containing protein n=1 Tax=Apiospora marii TaxID=335849 RepID=A0ABR1R091_9PEZI
MGTPFNRIAERDAQDAQRAFLDRFIAGKEDIVTFVANRLGWSQAGEFLHYHIGPFNVSISVANTITQQHVLIRFPIPGKVYGPWQVQKVRNEVMVLEYIAQETSIPVPQVLAWGSSEESPQHLGPFIIEEFMEGKNLVDLLRQPFDDIEDVPILDPDIDDTKLDFVYEQIAGFQLQLSRLGFKSIGAISSIKGFDGSVVTDAPPLTYDMNEVVAFAGFPADHFDSATAYSRATDYFSERARCLQLNLETHRNVGQEEADLTWKRYVARHCLEKLVPAYCPAAEDHGPFRLFCDNLRPANMLVDPDTMRITAVLDLEFTNALPAQYAYDVPWWLILRNPAVFVGEEGKQQLLDLFEPRKEQYIRAMERAEAKFPQLVPAEEPRLSARVRDSWDSGRFWFNLSMRSSFDADEVYWNFLYREGRGEAMLDQATLAAKEEFLRKKKSQFDAYYEEKRADARFEI